MAAARWQAAALILELQVQPGAARDAIAGLHGERLKLRIAAPPVDGRANAHLVAYLAASFGVRRSAVTILRGKTGSLKTVRIDAPLVIPESVAALLPDLGIARDPAPRTPLQRRR